MTTPSDATEELARRKDKVLEAASAAIEHAAGIEMLHMSLGNLCGGPGKDRRHDAVDAYRDLVTAVLELQGRDYMEFINAKWQESGRQGA